MEEKDIKIGTKVLYRSIITQNYRSNGMKTTITSKPWTLGSGEVVCKVDGISGGVSIKHLELWNT